MARGAGGWRVIWAWRRGSRTQTGTAACGESVAGQRVQVHRWPEVWPAADHLPARCPPTFTCT